MHVISRNIVLFAAFCGISTIIPSTADAACAVAIGKGEGKSMATAQRRAKRDARQKAGNIRPQTADFSEPACFVADDFKKGVATYGCEVQYSYCTAPKLPETPKKSATNNRKQKDWKLSHSARHKALAKWRNKHRNAGSGWSGAGHSGKFKRGFDRGNGRVTFGSWGATRTEISCLRFNASASAPSASEAGRMVNDALIRSMAANIGGAFRHGQAEMTGPACSQTGTHKYTCGQTARYCFQ